MLLGKKEGGVEIEKKGGRDVYRKRAAAEMANAQQRRAFLGERLRRKGQERLLAVKSH